jgi:hypothetical protein
MQRRKKFACSERPDYVLKFFAKKGSSADEIDEKKESSSQALATPR